VLFMDVHRIVGLAWRRRHPTRGSKRTESGRSDL
jgi:hypothetical protein